MQLKLLEIIMEQLSSFVTPLVAIMENLAYEYGLKGLKTAYISNSITDPEIKKGVRDGKY